MDFRAMIEKFTFIKSGGLVDIGNGEVLSREQFLERFAECKTEIYMRTAKRGRAINQEYPTAKLWIDARHKKVL